MCFSSLLEPLLAKIDLVVQTPKPRNHFRDSGSAFIPEGRAPIKENTGREIFCPSAQLGRTVGLQWGSYGLLHSYSLARIQKLLLIESSLSIIPVTGTKFYSVLDF